MCISQCPPHMFKVWLLINSIPEKLFILMKFFSESDDFFLFQYLDRRCVTDQECRRLPAPKDSETENIDLKYPWRPFNGSCVLECPPGYSEKQAQQSDNSIYVTCEKCNGEYMFLIVSSSPSLIESMLRSCFIFVCLPQGTCEKVCQTSYVNNIAAAQRLRGCTFIKNSLEIEIRGGSEYPLFADKWIFQWNLTLLFNLDIMFVSYDYRKSSEGIGGKFAIHSRNWWIPQDSTLLSTCFSELPSKLEGHSWEQVG